jgi:hypothetical protein
MSDLNFQNISTVQSGFQPKPVTLASATVITPTTFVTFITGTTQIATITPPVSGQHMLVTIHTNVAPVDYLTNGNILSAVDPLQNLPNIFIYDPIQQKYYGFATNLT